MLKKLGFLIALPLALILFFNVEFTGNAATYGTVGVDSGCGGDCHGYYTGHFNSQIIATNTGGNLHVTAFRTTLTSGNQFGDVWAMIRVVAHSGGTKVIDDYSKGSDLRREANSSYWQTINTSTFLLSGNNKIEFNIAYILKNPDGTIAESWYPIRRASNIL